MNLELMEPKHFLNLWLVMLIMIAADVLIQLYPNVHFFPKSQCELREFTLTSFETKVEVRHSVKYSHFVDENGELVIIRSTGKDRVGRKVKLYVYDSSHAVRENFEIKGIGICEIVLIFSFLMLSALTIYYFMNWRN